jgi:dTDP-4-amino-4,6-dideoxygalactose transaminase
MSEPTRPDSSAVIERVSAHLVDLLDAPEAFRGQQLRGGGPVAEFEGLLAERCGFPWCVATCNATTALMGLAIALDLRGRTVWFPKEHWEGSISAMRLMGARIRRYDPAGEAGHPGQLDEGAQFVITAADADVPAVRQLFGNAGCLIVEDSSRLPGISHEQQDRSMADVQVISFGPGKPLCLGEGGATLFRSREMHDRFIACTMHPERLAALDGRPPGFEPEALNARIHFVAAILGSETLRSGIFNLLGQSSSALEPSHVH